MALGERSGVAEPEDVADAVGSAVADGDALDDRDDSAEGVAPAEKEDVGDPDDDAVPEPVLVTLGVGVPTAEADALRVPTELRVTTAVALGERLIDGDPVGETDLRGEFDAEGQPLFVAEDDGLFDPRVDADCVLEDEGVAADEALRRGDELDDVDMDGEDETLTVVVDTAVDVGEALHVDAGVGVVLADAEAAADGVAGDELLALSLVVARPLCDGLGERDGVAVVVNGTLFVADAVTLETADAVLGAVAVSGEDAVDESDAVTVMDTVPVADPDAVRVVEPVAVRERVGDTVAESVTAPVRLGVALRERAPELVAVTHVVDDGEPVSDDAALAVLDTDGEREMGALTEGVVVRVLETDCVSDVVAHEELEPVADAVPETDAHTVVLRVGAALREALEDAEFVRVAEVDTVSVAVTDGDVDTVGERVKAPSVADAEPDTERELSAVRDGDVEPDEEAVTDGDLEGLVDALGEVVLLGQPDEDAVTDGEREPERVADGDAVVDPDRDDELEREGLGVEHGEAVGDTDAALEGDEVCEPVAVVHVDAVRDCEVDPDGDSEERADADALFVPDVVAVVVVVSDGEPLSDGDGELDADTEPVRLGEGLRVGAVDTLGVVDAV